MGDSAIIRSMYDTLLEALGPSHWWPGDTPFEVAVGAVLTQNTNWGNVEKAIGNLKAANVLEPRLLYELPLDEMAELIRPAGYFNIKANRLHNLLQFIKDETDFDLESLKRYSVDDLRPKILGVNGIGPETADAILLYALELPVFVIDAYTARLVQRHGLGYEGIDYHELQAIFMDALPENVAVYNEYHALIVRVGKEWCKKKAGLCDSCPLQIYLDQ